MISWDELVYDLNELCKLENGGGAEIEFEYAGEEYCIVVYRDWCSLAAIKRQENGQPGIEKTYRSLNELGSSQDFGFRLSEVWDQVSYYECRPDFEAFYLEEVLEAYRKAWENRKKNSGA